MRILFQLFSHSPGLVALAVLTGALSGLSNAGLLALINTALHTETPAADPFLVWSFVGLCALVPGTRAYSSYILSTLGQRRAMTLRSQLSRAILAAPLQLLESVGPHRLLATLTTDIGTIVGALTMLPLLFVQLTIVLGCLVYLGWLSLPVLGAVVLFLVVGIVTYQVPILRGERYQRQAREETDRLYAHFRAITSGIKELKLHARRQQVLLERLDATGSRLSDFSVISSTIFSAAAGWGQLVVFALIGMTIFLVPAFGPISSTTQTGYALILLYMMTPLEMILGFVPTLARARISLEKIEQMGLSLNLGERTELRTPVSDRVGSLGSWSRLELVGATHRYYRDGEESYFALGPVHLTLTPGETVFLVGGNGSGKTTLAKLITGLYSPEEGELRFNGEKVTDESRLGYMQHFAVVFSDFFLFESLLGLDGPGLDERARQYLEQLQIAHKVKIEGGELSTTDLSQGQRKRLALLTAYLEDRPIYVFDEWAADQDPTFKELFYRDLVPELKARGKTVLVISHDDHYYWTADRILKLDYGRLEYDGSLEGLYGRAAAGPDRPIQSLRMRPPVPGAVSAGATRLE